MTRASACDAVQDDAGNLSPFANSGGIAQDEPGTLTARELDTMSSTCIADSLNLKIREHSALYLWSERLLDRVGARWKLDTSDCRGFDYWTRVRRAEWFGAVRCP
jgi:hypothetical protein